jgi:hypothetical protein
MRTGPDRKVAPPPDRADLRSEKTRLGLGTRPPFMARQTGEVTRRKPFTRLPSLIFGALDAQL